MSKQEDPAGHGSSRNGNNSPRVSTRLTALVHTLGQWLSRKLKAGRKLAEMAFTYHMTEFAYHVVWWRDHVAKSCDEDTAMTVFSN